MKKVKPFDNVWNNPRADRQYDNMDISKGKKEKFNNDMMLYDEKSKSDRRLELIKRMVRGFNKNIEKAKGTPPKSASLTAAQKRARKLEDLLSRWYSWKNLQ
jgi:hypothetical protein